MKKRKRGRKLSRKRDQRKALLKSLAANLILRQKIRTTEAKAKEVSAFAEKLITKAKKPGISSVRFLTRFLTPGAVKKLINEISPRYKERKGGCVRIVKLGPRKSDGAKMAIIELIK